MNTSIIPTIEPDDDGMLRVSSETIAEGAGVQHKNVVAMINDNLVDLGSFSPAGAGVAFKTRPFETAGGIQHRRVFLLNEPQATLLMTYMRNNVKVRDFKKALVKGFFTMAQQLATAPVLTESQIVAQALQITNRQVQELTVKVAEDAPKVSYIDTFVADTDRATFKNVAANLRVKETLLREYLLAKTWIFKEESSRWSNKREIVVPQTRYTEYAQFKAYFIKNFNHDVPRFRDEIMHTLKITPPGATAIGRILKIDLERHGSIEAATAHWAARQEAKKNSTPERWTA